jgi:hypothetical protein
MLILRPKFKHETTHIQVIHKQYLLVHPHCFRARRPIFRSWSISFLPPGPGEANKPWLIDRAASVLPLGRRPRLRGHASISGCHVVDGGPFSLCTYSASHCPWNKRHTLHPSAANRIKQILRPMHAAGRENAKPRGCPHLCSHYQKDSS